jgi:hypothetical protein
MEQGALVYFFTLNALKARAIHTELEWVYGPESLALPTVKKWLRPFRQGRTNLFDDPRFGKPSTNDLGKQSALCLKKGRSVRARCFLTTSGLERRLAFRSFMTYWFGEISSSLGAACHVDQPKSKRVSYSKLLLTALMEQKAGVFQRIITGDEPWFFRDCPRDLVWVASCDEPPQRTKRKVDAKKCGVSIRWFVNEIHSLLNVLKETTYNKGLFADAVMHGLIENVRSRTRRTTLKGWLIHMDNARPHSSGRAQRGINASTAEFLSYPAYSPELARTTSFSLDISKENYLITIARAGRTS